MTKAQAFLWASIAGGHHGILSPQADVLASTPEADPAPFGGSQWQELRDHEARQLHPNSYQSPPSRQRCR
jgi:hypothetical protein